MVGMSDDCTVIYEASAPSLTLSLNDFSFAKGKRWEHKNANNSYAEEKGMQLRQQRQAVEMEELSLSNILLT